MLAFADAHVRMDRVMSSRIPAAATTRHGESMLRAWPILRSSRPWAANSHTTMPLFASPGRIIEALTGATYEAAIQKN